MEMAPVWLCTLFAAALILCSEAQTTGTAAMVTTTESDSEGGINVNLAWYYWLVIAVGAVAVLVLAAIICLCICCSCRRRSKGSKKRKRRKRKGVKGMEEIDLGNEEDDHELNRSDITLVNQLGIGEYGPIFDAEVKVKKNLISRALIKVFQKGTNQNLVDFSRDNDVLLKFNHPNVAKIIGLVSLPPYYIVCELTVNGDLKSFLLSSTSPDAESLTEGQLVAMGADAASGLAYLERAGYVHKDVAARNCVVAQDLSIKITDFKVGRFLFRSEYAVQADGSLMPLRWMPPEAIQSNDFTLASTVWSFGVLMWEIMSRGSFPYAELSNGEVINAVVQENQQLPHPTDECPETAYEIMKECWAKKPKQRPSMGHVRRMLESSILTNKYNTHPQTV